MDSSKDDIVLIELNDALERAEKIKIIYEAHDRKLRKVNPENYKVKFGIAIMALNKINKILSDD